MRIPISIKIVALNFISLLVIIGILSFIFYNISRDDLENSLGTTLQSIARNTVLEISGDAHQVVRESGDTRRDEFRVIRDHLRRVKKTHELTPDNIYTFRVDPDHKLFFAVMAHPKPFVGDPHPLPDSIRGLVDRAIGGESVRTGLYTDKNGEWISGFAPIKNSAGKVVGLLEVNYRVEKFFNDLRNRFYRIFFAGLVVALLGLGITQIIARTISKPINDLAYASGQVSRGDYDITVAVSSRDEIADLGQAFNSMVGAVKESSRKLNEYAEQLEDRVNRRTAEIGTILRNANEGLFLLDAEFRIGNRYSAVLEEMLNAPDLAGKELPAVLKNLLNDELLRELKGYLQLLFKKEMDISMLRDLNPLSEVELNIAGGEEGSIRIIARYMQFRFDRIYEGDEIQRLLVTARDITRETELNRKIAKQESDTQNKLKLLFNILHVSPVLLENFIKGLSAELARIQSLLESEGDDYREKLQAIFRSAHTLKGNANLLQMSFVADKAHEFEEEIEKLRENPDIEGKDFLGLAIRLNELNGLAEDLADLVNRLAGFQTAFSGRDENPAETLLASMGENVQRTAARMGKDVQFVYDKFDPESMPSRYAKVFEDVMTQLTLNAVNHGIESAGDRARQGKPASGRIELISIPDDDSFAFRVRDDGRGIQVERLREKALASGRISESEIGDWSAGKLAALIFEPGLSTAASAGKTAGRGVGMDMVRMKIREMGGKIRTSFAAGRFCEFQVFLPLEFKENKT